MTDSKWAQVNVRIEKILFSRIKKYLKSNDIALIDFVVNAFEEKLARKIKEDKESIGVDKFIDEMIALNPKTKIADIQITSNIIYEELKKQNEVLKLILRRATLSSKYTSSILGLQNEKQMLADLKFVEERVQLDLEKINLQGNACD